MEFALLFFIELLFLFFCSKLVIKSLAQIFYNLTRSNKGTIYLLAATFLPGTIIHELAHAITAGVLLVHVGGVEVMPEIQEGGVKLGTAQIGQTDPVRRALIGLAPVLVGLLIILGTLFFFVSSFKDGSLPFWAYPVIVYSLFEISNTMFSSRKDLEGIGVFLVIILSILAGLYLVGIHQPFGWIGNLLGSSAHFFKLASLLLFIPIGIDLATYGLAKLLLKR